MNESKEQQLVGTYVELYLVGGHILSGEIKLVDKGKICIENNKRVFLIYRDKISGIWVNASLEKVSEPIEQITSEEYNQGIELEEEITFPENDIGIGNDTGLSLPSDILIPGFLDEDDNLSMVFSGDNKSSGNLNIVLIEDDKSNSSTASQNRKSSKTNP